jgi:hypothetical protein
MPSAIHLRPGDPLLIPFLDASSDEAASQALEQLLATTEPVIRDSVRRELARSMAGARHMDDVAGDVRLRIVAKLWALRRQAGEPIDNLLAYVSRAAEYGCYAFLRAQYPERSRFRNRLRYAVGHQPSTALRCDEHGIWQCQTARPVRRPAEAGSTAAFMDDPAGWLSAAGINPSLPLPALTDRLLALLDRPIELDRLVDALAGVLGIADAPPARRRGDGDEEPVIADPSPGAGDVLEHRDTLLRTWNEIIALPPRQRAALLLNLRDPDGGAILHLLPSTDVVSTAGIAAALELDADALADLWDKLPLDDLSIAAQLGLTRQQVINLRKSARARLARRLRGDAL